MVSNLSGDQRFEVQLKRSNKLFSKKPIVQVNYKKVKIPLK